MLNYYVEIELKINPYIDEMYFYQCMDLLIRKIINRFLTIQYF